MEEIKNKINAARLKYKPDYIKTFIVAQAPPDDIERFFYYEDVKEKDFLFLGIIEVLYPDLKNQFLNGEMKRSPLIKQRILNRFKTDGYFLLDLSDIPMSLIERPLQNCVDNLITKLEKGIPIILIKSDVYEFCYRKLANGGFAVINRKVPFPSTGQQANFRKEFSEAIKMIS